ncbi:alpha-amylase family glycosyl hydrolase [Laceyella putida]|uniref:Alpha-amylase family glycosyl hydrolase n=1 Tax=Laceyella putida TaxID=110101 RepID=A0ABW2RHF3_9BACL
MFNKSFHLLLLIFCLVVQTISLTSSPTLFAAERTVTLVGTLQDELGGSSEWNPADPKTLMAKQADGTYQLTGVLPAGTYEYKVALNGTWDENYGLGGKQGGDNYQLTVDKETPFTFIYNDETHLITIPLPKDQQPRIVGDLQPELGAGAEWSPAESTAILTDDDHDNLYTYTVKVPKGKHEFKVVLGHSWQAPAYPSDNVVLQVREDAIITFTYNHDTKAVYTDYDPGVPDGSVQANELRHDTWDVVYRKPFGAIKTGQSVTLRLGTKKGDLSQAKLFTRNLTSGKTSLIQMKRAGWTELGKKRIEYWEATFAPTEKGVFGYKFIARDGNSVKEYGDDPKQGHTGTSADANASLFQLTVYDPTYHTPDWMKEAVVYQIFPDRFYNGNKQNDRAKANARGQEPIEHRKWSQLPDNPRMKEQEGYDGDGIWSNDFFGGDLKGIQAKLDYIQSLGVNTLYLNPIAQAVSNHKYDATDYQAIDPMFGSPAEFQEFVKELRKRHMHLILDGVFNHVGDDSIYFDRYGKYKTVGAYEYWSRVYDLVNTGVKEEDAKKRAEKQLLAEGQSFSPYGFHNWFNIENKKKNGVYSYQAWWGFDSLPEIKAIPGEAVDHPSELNNKDFANYIMYDDHSVAKSWLNRGATGWRLDVANEVDLEFWREFRKEIKQDKKKEPLILGEIWDDASAYFLGDLFDSVMNYRFREAMIDYLKNGNAEHTAESLTAIQEDYPPEAFHALMNLLGSHDTPRAAFVLGNGTDIYERAEQDPAYDHALGIKRLKLASIIQMGYAGAPTIYYGDEAGMTGSKDPDDRRTYPWGKEDHDLIRHYQKIGQVRGKHQALFAHGDLHHLYAQDDILVFSRSKGKEFALIATNRGNKAKTVELDVKGLMVNHTTLADQLDTKYVTRSHDGKLTITIPAMSGRMLVSTKPVQKPPKPVAQLKATAGNHQAVLHWKGAAKTFHVYQSTVQGGPYQKAATTNRTQITLNGLHNGRAYYFAVTSVDQAGNESAKTVTGAVIPHIPLTSDNTSITHLTSLQDSVLDLASNQRVAAEISIKGATEQGQAEGLWARLEVKEPGSTEWTPYEAVYSGQNETANRFVAEFTPFGDGTYSYRFAFSSNLGHTWLTSETQEVTFRQGEDRTPPATGVTLKQPTQESGQVNLSWSIQDGDDPYLAVITRDGKPITTLADMSQSHYQDLDVSNGTTYQYQVKLYDRYGNAVSSNIVSVTPDLVMVKVTFKVHVPDYTPQDVNITIPNSENGWNTEAWTMSRNGAVTNDFEYTTELPEGEQITYKYVKGGSWEQEGLADHTPNQPDDDDVSYYGYGATGTDLHLTVTNQGGNQMIVQDHILRWIDQPVVITSHTDGQTVTSPTITLRGNAIKEGMLTINGEKVTIQPDMSFAHTLNLKEGTHLIQLHIEPSEENKSTIFKNDGGAIAKNTKDLAFTIHRK